MLLHFVNCFGLDLSFFPARQAVERRSCFSVFFLSRNVWPCCKNHLLNSIFFVSPLSLKLPYTFRGVSRPCDVARPV